MSKNYFLLEWDENAALFFLGVPMEQKSKCACANSICHLCAQLPGLPNNVIQTKFQSKCCFVSLLIFDQFPRLSHQCIMNFFGRKYFIAIIIILTLWGVPSHMCVSKNWFFIWVTNHWSFWNCATNKRTSCSFQWRWLHLSI